MHHEANWGLVNGEQSGRPWTYKEVFEVEIDGWCYGIAQYPGEFYPNLVLIVLREMTDFLKASIQHGVRFDICSIANRFATASRHRINPNAIALYMVSLLPAPHLLNSNEQGLVREIVDQVEKQIPNVWPRVRRRWMWDQEPLARFDPSDERTRPSVFISHSSLDKPFCSWLRNELSARGIRVWIDDAEVEAGDRLSDEIRGAIESVGCLLVCVSKNSDDSIWVRREIEWAEDLALRQKKPRIIPLIIEGSIAPEHLAIYRWHDMTTADSRDEKFPALLRIITGDENYKHEPPSGARLELDHGVMERFLYSQVPAMKAADSMLAHEKHLLPVDTRPWTSEQLLTELTAIKVKIGYAELNESARKWWDQFEQENAHRMALVFRLAEELLWRRASIGEFFMAYVYSNTDNIQANLHYLDYQRLKKAELAKAKLKAPIASSDTVTGTSDNR